MNAQVLQVVKVLNNSLLLALGSDGRERVLMGKGIGFRKAAGGELNAEEVDKVFVIQDKDLKRNIIRLASEVDELYFAIAKNVIDYALETYRFKLMDHLYLALTDHLAFAVRRMREGLLIQNFYSYGMRKFNPREYDVGRYALELFKKETGIALPRDEAYNIAFHFINAQVSDVGQAERLEITKIVSAVLDIIRLHYNRSFDEESFDYARLIRHLQLFAQRLLSDEQSLGGEDFLYRQIAEICQNENACVDKIAHYIRHTYGREVAPNERSYLLIYLHRIQDSA